MKKLALLVAALVAVPAMLASSAFADSPGQLSNGTDNYKVKNVTTNSAYAKSASAACNQTVKYSILMANSDFGQLENVTVKATLPGSISISGKNVNGETTSVSGSVSVSIPAKATLSYVAGTTTYYVYKADGTVASQKTLADGVAASGINTGTLAGSTQARVYFQAKVNCQVTPPAEKYIKVCELATKNIITINEKNFDAAKHSKNLADCATKPPVEGEITVCETATKEVVTIKESAFDSNKHSKNLSDCDATPVTPVTPTTPTELPQTGATGLIAVIATIATAGAGYLVTARKNLLG